MIPSTTLALAGVTHAVLKAHLLPGDGKEAAAILLCSRTPLPRRRLLVQGVIMVPHSECSVREVDRISWPGEYLEQAIDLAEKEDLTIILLHSHPGGWLEFSPVDNASDNEVLPCLFQALGEEHGSAIMTPDGAIRARLYSPTMESEAVDLVTAAGDDVMFWWDSEVVRGVAGARPKAFTGAMTRELNRLSAGVIGVSGTGSVVGEQLARLGFAQVTLVDFDEVEGKNLNRILNSTLQDVANNRKKVDMFADAVARHRGDGVAKPIPQSIVSRNAILEIAKCDVVFCCVDTQEARQIADLIAATFLIPLFDVGVLIPTRKAADDVVIADVCGRIDYVQPGGSTLLDREVYSSEGLRAEYLRRTDHAAFERELAEGYISGLIEEAPSVITLNMRAASAVANEFIARAYPFRHEPNRNYARTSFSLAACEEDYYAEDDFPDSSNGNLGRGTLEPLLGLPLFKAPRRIVT